MAAPMANCHFCRKSAHLLYFRCRSLHYCGVAVTLSYRHKLLCLPMVTCVPSSFKAYFSVLTVTSPKVTSWANLTHLYKWGSHGTKSRISRIKDHGLCNRISLVTQMETTVVHHQRYYSLIKTSTVSQLGTRNLETSNVITLGKNSDVKNISTSKFRCSHSNHTDQEDTKEQPREKFDGLRGKILTVPNILTTARMALSPVLGYMVLQESYHLACGMFVVAGISDLLDGYIARHWKGQTSALGSFLDPLADKLLISIVFVTLTMVNLIPVPLTVLVLARDIGLVVAAFYVRYISLTPPVTLFTFFDIRNQTAQLNPTLLSKVNTCIQLSLVALTLAAPVFNYVNHPVLQGIWWLTAGTTLLTGIQYIIQKDTYKILKAAKKK